jgi:kynurenine formamidase
MHPDFPYKVIDLSHSLNEKKPSWNGGCGFTHEAKLNYSDHKENEQGFRVQQIKMHAGIGTHIDAPAHCIPGGATVEALPLEQLIRPCLCIDVSKSAQEDFMLQPEGIDAFEKKHRPIADGDFVIVYTGWDQHWHQADRYRNQYQFPSISANAAKLLLKRNIAGIGIDTLSPDCPSNGFPVHQHLLSAGKYIVENVAQASLLPAVGSFSMALPMKGEGLTEAPIRLIALIPK